MTAGGTLRTDGNASARATAYRLTRARSRLFGSAVQHGDCVEPRRSSGSVHGRVQQRQPAVAGTGGHPAHGVERLATDHDGSDSRLPEQ